MENWELTMQFCQFPSVHWAKLFIQTLCFCNKTQKHCGGVFVVFHKIAWPSSLLLYLVSFSVCSYWLSLCLQAQNDLASLAFIPLAFLDTALCWWISFTILLGGVCCSSNLVFFLGVFLAELWWLFCFVFCFFLNQLQVYVLSTPGKVKRTSVTECSGKLLLQPMQGKLGNQ